MSFYDVFGLLSSICQIVVVIGVSFVACLPRSRVAELEKSLTKVDLQLHSSIEEGILHDVALAELADKLECFRHQAKQLSQRSERAATLFQQLIEMTMGLTCIILGVENKVYSLRAKIASLQCLLEASPEPDSINGASSDSTLGAPNPLPLDHLQRSSSAPPLTPYRRSITLRAHSHSTAYLENSFEGHDDTASSTSSSFAPISPATSK